MKENIVILGIESSCDDTSAAVVRGTTLLSNVIASQSVHEKWGGVVPELASRAHEQNIVPVIDRAIKDAGIEVEDIDAIAFTHVCWAYGFAACGYIPFAKGLSLTRSIPMIECDHLLGHILVHFIDEEVKNNPHPEFPFLTLLVSGVILR